MKKQKKKALVEDLIFIFHVRILLTKQKNKKRGKLQIIIKRIMKYFPFL